MNRPSANISFVQPAYPLLMPYAAGRLERATVRPPRGTSCTSERLQRILVSSAVASIVATILLSALMLALTAVSGWSHAWIAWYGIVLTASLSLATCGLLALMGAWRHIAKV